MSGQYRRNRWHCQQCDIDMDGWAFKQHLLKGQCKIFEIIDKAEEKRLREFNADTFKGLRASTMPVAPTIVQKARLKHPDIVDTGLDGVELL